MSITKPLLIVLDTGMDSRYGSLKQNAQFVFFGEKSIAYTIYDAIFAGFNKVVFVIRKNIEEEFKGVFSGKFGNQIRKLAGR